MRISWLKNKKGSVLVTAFIFLVAMTTLTIMAIQRSATEYNFAKRNMLSTEAYYLAEAGAEKIAHELAKKVANYEDEPAGDTDQWTDLCGTEIDFMSTDYDLTYTCTSLTGEYTTVSAEGIVSIERAYEVIATVTYPEENVTATVGQVFSRKKTYTFQHAVFYATDLELLPGSDMTLTGKIHANNDVYIDADSGATLTIDTDFLRTAGKVYNMRKDSGAGLAGDVLIRVEGTSDYEKMLLDTETSPLDSRRSDWAAASQTRWGGTVQSGVHGITSLAVPEVGSIQPDGYYATEATVKVVNGVVYKDGMPLTEGVDIPSGTVTTDTDFYNNREEAYVRMTNIDLEKLAGWDEVMEEGVPVKKQVYSNHLPGDGLLYATRDDVGTDEQGGVRLVNGTTIDNTAGLTVVTNLPGYIQGDYNSVDKKSAAVICDAINLLSNNWDDSNSTQSLDYRTAAGTAVNAAIIAGIGVTIGNNYGGGLENYPRLHEDWGGTTLTIRGSFVSLWDSQIATGQWKWGDPQYKAPIRDWDFDTDFFEQGNLPTYTPFAVELVRLAWWKTSGEE
ncbi:MAG: hypothetical protein PVH45_03765 [Candidatus Omnitrophota bacterium]|jgi:hypothetical protein